MKGRIGGVFKNRGFFNRVTTKINEKEDIMKKLCLTETSEVIQEEKK